MTASPTRRQFLGAGTAVVALGISTRTARAMSGGMHVIRPHIPTTATSRTMCPNEWLPDPPPDHQFRALAMIAMDAATHAGAEFSDVRIGVQRECGGMSASMALGYGIRARVDGAWGFQYGSVLTSDAVAEAARVAVGRARVSAGINATLGERMETAWAPAPTVTGSWQAPISIDPFTVLLDDHEWMQLKLAEPVKHLGYVQANGTTAWTNDIRVFASTDGSLVSQNYTRGRIEVGVYAWLPDHSDDVVFFRLTENVPQSLGFEMVLRPDLDDRTIAVAEDAKRWRALPLRPFSEVGRYPAVLDGLTMASVIGQTLNLALDGDRITGGEADASGGSFLTPLMTQGTPVPEFSPLLTMTSTRAMPSGTAVQWDDDGVPVRPYTLIDRGALVDFHTTRATAPLFGPWYHAHGRAMQLHGGSVAPTPASLPVCTGGDLAVAPSVTNANVTTLIRDMTQGLLVIGGTATANAGLTNGVVGGMTIEVRRGQPVARLGSIRLAFLTNTIIRKGLIALGDRGTMATTMVSTPKGMPWQEMSHPITAPAASVAAVDVQRTDLGV